MQLYCHVSLIVLSTFHLRFGLYGGLTLETGKRRVRQLKINLTTDYHFVHFKPADGHRMTLNEDLLLTLSCSVLYIPRMFPTNSTKPILGNHTTDNQICDTGAIYKYIYIPNINHQTYHCLLFTFSFA